MNKVVKSNPSNDKPDPYRRVEVLATLITAVAALVAAFAALFG